MKLLTPLLVLVLAVQLTCAAETDCFAPYLTDKPPKIVETISREVKDGVEVTQLKFLSRVAPESGRKSSSTP